MPANVEVVPWVDHAEVLPQVSATLTHGGSNTVLASLAHGVPVVCVPMGRDQPDVAARVAHAGVGVRLSGNPSRTQLATAVRRVLADPSLRANAERLGAILREEIEADRGIAELEALAGAGEERFAREALSSRAGS